MLHPYILLLCFRRVANSPLYKSTGTTHWCLNPSEILQYSVWFKKTAVKYKYNVLGTIVPYRRFCIWTSSKPWFCNAQGCQKRYFEHLEYMMRPELWNLLTGVCLPSRAYWYELVFAAKKSTNHPHMQDQNSARNLHLFWVLSRHLFLKFQSIRMSFVPELFLVQVFQ